MKKIFCFVAALLFAQNALAETIIVIDDNGYVRSTPQIITTPTVVTQPAVTVVRETPVQNSYYYDRNATGTAVAAGITTAVIGSLLFGGIYDYHHHHHKHHRMAPPPAPHGGHHGGGHHGGGHRR